MKVTKVNDFFHSHFGGSYSQSGVALNFPSAHSFPAPEYRCRMSANVLSQLPVTMRTTLKTCLQIPAALLLAAATTAHAASPVTVTIQADKPGAQINPYMWGVFFEDINLGADGGLYAEMVKNRSFEFPEPRMGWIVISPSMAKGQVSFVEEGPVHPADKRFLRMKSEANAPYGISNEGFRGMGVRKGDNYIFSAQIRASEGAPRLTIQIVGSDGTTLASERLEGFNDHWHKYSVTLKPNDTDPKARLDVILDTRATVDLDQVSLFPEKTWKNRPGGLRADMVQMLADMKPGFVRFPGGCIVEGSHLDRRYQWKTTIGPIEDRIPLINRWNYEFRHRPTPDYFQTFGLGFFEFFQMSEDIGATAMPILNCGMACQFNSGELVPMDQLDTYIQDALDLIEFANGPATSTWGAKRAAMGHPEPFNMKLLGIGNEQWAQPYIDRLAAFTKALKAKHPEIQLISAAGPAPGDERFDFLWPKLRELNADIVDEHCYANPVWFFSSANRYDKYDRKGPKVFMGEYAAQSVAIVSTKNRNNLECALSEAAFMTGLERNADVVTMASYAPLFAHIDGWQWTPNLIWTDNLRIYGTPNYYVQKLYSLNRGDVVLPVNLSTGEKENTAAKGRIGLATYRSSAEFKDVKVTRGAQTLFASDFSAGPGQWERDGGEWSIQNGAYRQSNERTTDAKAYVGSTSWSDYTLSLKARKLGGSEGFIIVFRDEPLNTYVQWNVGGWGNTRHGIQEMLGVQPRIVAQVNGSIEANRWYDVRIELKGSQINCYLDDKLVQSAEVPVPKHGGIFASAVRDDKAGEVILKLVNATPESRDVSVRLEGVKGVKSGAKAFVLSDEKLNAENSLDYPTAIVPRETSPRIRSKNFKHAIPANSFVVLRVPADI
jgi:alpha-N-arabinofuranosidase